MTPMKGGGASRVQCTPQMQNYFFSFQILLNTSSWPTPTQAECRSVEGKCGLSLLIPGILSYWDE
jgi:hypothetical protein